MKQNMGLIDKIIRILLAVLVLILYLTGQLTGVAAVILGIFAVIFIITSTVGFCPLYKPLNICTKKCKK